MKKQYNSPEFEFVKLLFEESICASRTEDAGGGVDWGDEEDFGN